MIRKIHIIALALLAVVSCGGSKSLIKGSADRFPQIRQDGKVAIAAHRGFWNCEEAGYTENSIAALKAAQDNGLWGSEFDIHLTEDNVVIVNHNPEINGINIHDNRFEVFKDMKLKNGESVPTLDAYLTQAEKCKTTVLVAELKSQKSQEKEMILWRNTVELLKKHKLYNPERVVFISFSKYICDLIAAEAPQFVNQYLSGNIAPAELASQKINGIDYQYNVFVKHPEWVEESHKAGMTVNVWTVNDEEMMERMTGLGIDQLTTNHPLVARRILEGKEFRLSK